MDWGRSSLPFFENEGPAQRQSRPDGVEQLLPERDGNMMQHVAEHDEVILSGLGCGDFLDVAPNKPDFVPRSLIQAPKARGYVDGGDFGIGIGGVEPFGHSSLAAAHLQYFRGVRRPLTHAFDIGVDVEKSRSIGFADLAFIRAEPAADERSHGHFQNAPPSFARMRGATRSTIRESRI